MNMEYGNIDHIDYQTYCTCPVVWHGIYPPPSCWFCEQRGLHAQPWGPVVPLEPESLSDEEIDRIARRVAELLKPLL